MSRLDVCVHQVNKISELWFVLRFDFHPGVIRIPEPLARWCFRDDVRALLLDFLHMQVSHNRVKWRTHGASMCLSDVLTLVA